MVIHIPDLINGVFELGGGLLLFWFNVRAILRDKKVRGVHWAPVVWFDLWGYWNLFYYPHLGQMLSFMGGCIIVSANTVWLSLAWRYRKN
jgi:hypothetical protein